MAVYFDSLQIKVYISGSWMDITEYVVSDIDADWGIVGNTPKDKIASVGAMKLLLNNTNGFFSPNKPGSLSGWGKNIPLKIVATYEGISYTRFKGRIANIGLSYEVEGMKVVQVIVNDWFDIAINYPFSMVSVATNKTTDEAANLILSALPIQPDSTNIHTGSSDPYPYVFSDAGTKGTAYSELSKLALSEFSYIYLRKDKDYGEQLVVESRQSRVGLSPSKVIKSREESPRLLKQNGGNLLLQNGNRLVLHSYIEPVFNNMKALEIKYGDNLINQIAVKNHPSRVDATLQNLFNLDSPIKISAGQTLSDIKVYYKDPTGQSQNVSGINMQTPVATTDYQMFANKDGTGTNLTSNLSVSVQYGSNSAIYTLTNTGATSGYITLLKARGYGIYSYNPIEVIINDTDSINDTGLKEFTIDQRYQSNISISESIATVLLTQNSEDRVITEKITMLANLNNEVMQSFLTFDVGDLIHIVETNNGIDAYYFIQSVRFKIKQGGIVEFSWGLVESLAVNDGDYWLLEIPGKSELEETTYISY